MKKIEKYTFKLKDEEEFFPIEVSEKMRDFLENCEDNTMSAETNEYKIHHIDSILETLEMCCSFERDACGGFTGKRVGNYDLFAECESWAEKTNCEFIGIKKIRL